MPDHKDFCDGFCDEGRECWRGVLMSPEEAAERGIRLFNAEQIRLLCADDPHWACFHDEIEDGRCVECGKERSHESP